MCKEVFAEVCAQRHVGVTCTQVLRFQYFSPRLAFRLGPGAFFTNVNTVF